MFEVLLKRFAHFSRYQYPGAISFFNSLLLLLVIQEFCIFVITSEPSMHCSFIVITKIAIKLLLPPYSNNYLVTLNII